MAGWLVAYWIGYFVLLGICVGEETEPLAGLIFSLGWPVFLPVWIGKFLVHVKYEVM